MKKQDHKLLIGAHMLIAGGFAQAIEKGAAIGCTTIQIFTKSNRQWRARQLQQEEIEEFIAAKEKFGIEKQHIITHSSYLINVASSSAEIAKKSVAAIQEELLRCDTLEIPYLVMHPGSRLQNDKQASIKTVAHNLTIAIEKAQARCHLVLENTAGQGGAIGSTFEELMEIIDLLPAKIGKSIGICIDTCHVFSAGYPLSTEDDYEDLVKKLDRIFGLDRIKVFHLNDSKKECGSRIDRHEHIGKGKIGLDFFAYLCNDKRFFDVPKILETPKKHPHDDETNLKALHSLLTAATKKKLNVGHERAK